MSRVRYASSGTARRMMAPANSSASSGCWISSGSAFTDSALRGLLRVGVHRVDTEARRERTYLGGLSGDDERALP